MHTIILIGGVAAGMIVASAAKRSNSNLKVMKLITRDLYYLQGDGIFIKLKANSVIKRFFCIQIIKVKDISKRIYILSVALYNEMIVYDKRNMVFCYSLSCDPVYPVHVAINEWLKYYNK